MPCGHPECSQDLQIHARAPRSVRHPSAPRFSVHTRVLHVLQAHGAPKFSRSAPGPQAPSAHRFFMHTWQRLMCVRSSPAFSVDGVGFLNISFLSMVASQKL